MKKLISIFAILFLPLLSMGVDKIVTQDPTRPGIFKVNGPTVSNGVITSSGSIALSSLSTNGASLGNVITFTNGTWQPVGFSAGGESTTASNIGGGTNIFSSIVGFDLRFKTLLPGTGISFTDTGSNITINSTGGSTSSNNFTTYLAQNISPSGAGVYTTILAVTNGQTSGNLDVSAKVLYTDNNASGAAITGARLLEVSLSGATTNIIDSSAAEHTTADIYHAPFTLGPICRTAVQTNIYIIQGVVASVPGAGEGWRPFWTTLSGTTFSGTNCTWITIKRY